LANIEKEIKNLIELNNYKSILEAGCGTGRWISSLEEKGKEIFGIDYSFNMMNISKSEKSDLNLVNADAVYLPFKNYYFDFIFCVNAIHHFQNKDKFISECKRTLSTNGMLSVFGVDPHIDRDWYVYDYFESVYENDLKRFPSLELLKRLLEAEKLVDIEIKVAEEVFGERIGEDVLSDHFLGKKHCSQLANLSDEEYQKGIDKIKNKIKKNPKTVFKTSVIFYLVSAKKK
jgi:SAM-dependent methyltransferase